MKYKLSGFSDISKAMGLVFGDIGTSPIYTLTVIFTLTKPTPEHIFGILSLIVWTLILLVTIEYWWLAMSLSHQGEGGVIVLKEILVRKIKKGRAVGFYMFLGYLGISLLMGDGVITPAISILSAVEGLPLIPGLQSISHEIIVIITVAITLVLFYFQHKGTDKVSTYFGPIMLLWFGVLFVTGGYSVVSHPEVFKAVSPMYALDFLMHNGIMGFFVLSEVILCATGGEALYADMGHLGAQPIRSAWLFVFIALLFNYMGQGAYLLGQPQTGLVLFGMIKYNFPYLYVPFLILTTLATIIASQAMISAVFSLVYQGITTRMFPLMKIDYTSTEIKSQIYIGAVNWGLMVAVIFIILLFQSSTALAAAYGLAVTITMTISSIFMMFIFSLDKNWLKFAFSILVFVVDMMFFGALLSKIPHGGYWSLIIASVPFGVTFIWIHGQKLVYKYYRSVSFEIFELSYTQIYESNHRIPGTALFMTRNFDEIPPYLMHTIISSNIIYEKNILISLVRTDVPFQIESQYLENLAPGLSGLKIVAGYQEVVDLPTILKKHEIKEKVIFYGVEDIITGNIFLKIYSVMKKLSPNFVQFYKLPFNKVHGVITRVEI